MIREPYRKVYFGLARDPAFMALSSRARQLFLFLPFFCDDAGAFAWRPAEMARDVFPGESDVDGEALLSECVGQGLVMPYRDDRKRRYGAMRNFYRHQQGMRRPERRHFMPPRVRQFTASVEVEGGPGADSVPDSAQPVAATWPADSLAARMADEWQADPSLSYGDLATRLGVTLGAVAGTDFRLKIRLSVGIVPPRRIESAESGFPAVDDSDQVVENTLYDGGMNRLNRISSNSEASTNVGQTVETVAKISSDETALNRTVSEGSKKERKIRRDFVSTPQPAAASPESQVLDSLAVEQEGAQQSPQVADARSRLWSEGRARLQDIMDVDDGAARRLLGQLRKFARDDCELVLDVLDEAWDRRPTDPRAWLVTAVKARALQRENTAAGALASVRAWLAAYQAAGAAEDGPGLLSDLLLGGHALPPARASPGAAYGLS